LSCLQPFWFRHALVYELAEAFIEIADHDTFRHEIFEFLGIKAAELRNIELDRILGEWLGLCYAAEDLLAAGLVVDELPRFEVLSCDKGEAGLVVAKHDSEGCWGHVILIFQEVGSEILHPILTLLVVIGDMSCRLNIFRSRTSFP